MEQINPNLLSKEKLCEIIKQKDKQIESLEKNNKNDIRNCFYWQVACFFIAFPTIIISTNITYSLQQKHIVYGYYIIGVIASIYSVYKAVIINKRIFDNKNIKEWDVEKEILVEELSTEELKNKLIIAESEEDYDFAVIIRDELKKRVQ